MKNTLCNSGRCNACITPCSKFKPAKDILSVLFAIILASILCFIVCLTSCASIDVTDQQMDKAVNIVTDFVDRVEKAYESRPLPFTEPSVDPTSPSPPTTKESIIVQATDSVPFSDLDFCWGGFKGSSAKLVEGCEIGSLKIDSELSYKWVTGGCELLGASSSSDYNSTIACLFCQIDGRWREIRLDIHLPQNTIL